MANLKQRPDGTWEDDGVPVRATPAATTPTAPVAPVNMFPAAVDRQTTTKGSNWSTTTHTPVAGAAKAQAALDSSVGDQVEAERQRGVAAQAVETQRAENATIAAAEADKNAAEMQARTDAANTRKASLAADAEKQYQSYLTAKPEAYWGSKTQGQKAAAWIGVALSGLGNALAGRGGQNEALSLLMGDMDAHTNKEKERIQKMHEGYLKTTKDRDSVMDSLNQELGLLGLKSAATKEATAKRAESALLAKGGGVVAADSAKNVGALRAAAEKDKVEALARLTTSSTKGGSSSKVTVDVDDAAAAAANAAKAAKVNEATSSDKKADSDAMDILVNVEKLSRINEPTKADLKKEARNISLLEHTPGFIKGGDALLGTGMLPKSPTDGMTRDGALYSQVQTAVAAKLGGEVLGKAQQDAVTASQIFKGQAGQSLAVRRLQVLTPLQSVLNKARETTPERRAEIEKKVATTAAAFRAKWGDTPETREIFRIAAIEAPAAQQRTPVSAGIEPPAVQSLTTTAPAAAQAPAPPAGIPQGSRPRKTKDGRQAWQAPDGRVYIDDGGQ